MCALVSERLKAICLGSKITNATFQVKKKQANLAQTTQKNNAEDRKKTFQLLAQDIT